MLLYLTWRYAKRSRLMRAHIPAQDVTAIERRIIIAQSLYALAAALCVINTYWSIVFIFLVQLNYALAPHFRASSARRFHADPLTFILGH